MATSQQFSGTHGMSMSWPCPVGQHVSHIVHESRLGPCHECTCIAVLRFIGTQSSPFGSPPSAWARNRAEGAVDRDHATPLPDVRGAPDHTERKSSLETGHLSNSLTPQSGCPAAIWEKAEGTGYPMSAYSHRSRSDATCRAICSSFGGGVETSVGEEVSAFAMPHLGGD
ncbi:hypothetical protein B0T18DRAFT_492052 [Schizothecium vesticola]|uniref:Uncharacterized protein n=1 Tax=Schizothecium vesticola TaxID=314040 RepID=A0AA40BPG2_9PEZI|nr:hypothetical protein B0T18DRAFT_492052 [Schizothecium vesticola]